MTDLSPTRTALIRLGQSAAVAGFSLAVYRVQRVLFEIAIVDALPLTLIVAAVLLYIAAVPSEQGEIENVEQDSEGDLHD